MADHVTPSAPRGLSSEQLAEEQAQALPDREAMSILGTGGLTGALPIPIDTQSPLPPITPPSPPEITPPSPPPIAIPANISPGDAATLASVAGDLNEIQGDVQSLGTDINGITSDLEDITDPNSLIN